MKTPTHELVQVPPQGSPQRQPLYDQCIQTRIAVFVDEQKFPLDVEIEAADETATHILLRLVPSGAPIGTIRIHKPQNATYYKLARLVVLKEYRKHGLGAALVNRAHEWALKDHVESGLTDPATIIAHSQIPAKPFYARLGYIPEGDEFDEDGAPHQKMVARIPVRG